MDRESELLDLCRRLLVLNQNTVKIAAVEMAKARLSAGTEDNTKLIEECDNYIKKVFVSFEQPQQEEASEGKNLEPEEKHEPNQPEEMTEEEKNSKEISNLILEGMDEPKEEPK